MEFVFSAEDGLVRSDTRTYPFAFDDPFQPSVEFSRLRAHDPITRVKMRTGDHVWLVTRYEDVRSILSDNRFSRDLNRPDAARLHDGEVSKMTSHPFADPPELTRWRKLVSKALTPRRIEGMRDRVRAITDQLLDDVEQAGPPADLIETVAYPLPVKVVCELLGIDVVDQKQFHTWTVDAIGTRRRDGDPLTGEELAKTRTAALMALATHVQELVQAKRDDLGTDLLSGLIAAQEDNDRLTDEEVVTTVIILLIAGYESTAHHIGKGLLALFRNPGQLAALRADPSLTANAVEEMLRYGSLEDGLGAPRYATEEVIVSGVRIPKGATVLLVRKSANRDESRFHSPDEFDITRAEANQHISFGAGPHFCLGAALARLELQTVFSLLMTRFPRLALTVPVDEVPWDLRLTGIGPEELVMTW